MIEQSNRPAAETAAELAKRFGRSAVSMRNWLAEPGAPALLSLRRTARRPAAEYDPLAVESFLRATGRLPALPDPAADDDRLMTLPEAADYAGIQFVTARSYVSRTQWPAPDEPAVQASDGRPERPARWRRSSIDAARAARRRMS